MSSGTIIAFVFARGGSTGIPGKNLEEIGGRTLIARAVETARATGLVERVVVSTDDDDIAREAERAGAEIPFMRPPELASSTAAEWMAWQHAVSQEAIGEFDVFLSVPPTAPLRRPDDLVQCVRRYERGDVDLVVSGSKSSRSPYFNMVRSAGSGRVELVSDLANHVVRRQDVPATFDLTTVGYVSSPGHILRSGGVFDGRVGLVCVPRTRAIDIDEPADLEMARFLAARPELLEGDARKV